MIAMAAPAVCAQSESTEVERPPEGLPAFFDASYEWRDYRDHGSQSVEAMFRLPLDMLFGERDDWTLHLQKVGFAGGYLRSYGITPHAERAYLAAVYTVGIDESARFADMSPDSDYQAWGFPFQRSTAMGLSLNLAAGWMHSSGMQHGATVDSRASQDALRVENVVQLTGWYLGFRGQAALNVNLRDGPAVEWEAGFWFSVGEGILPLGIAVGYHYLGTQRAGGGSFSLRIGVHL